MSSKNVTYGILNVTDSTAFVENLKQDKTKKIL